MATSAWQKKDRAPDFLDVHKNELALAIAEGTDVSHIESASYHVLASIPGGGGAIRAFAEVAQRGMSTPTCHGLCHAASITPAGEVLVRVVWPVFYLGRVFTGLVADYDPALHLPVLLTCRFLRGCAEGKDNFES